LQPIFFTNPFEILDAKFIEMTEKYIKLKNDIDDYFLLEEIRYVLGRDYYKDAKAWFNKFKDAEWWREDLVE